MSTVSAVAAPGVTANIGRGCLVSVRNLYCSRYMTCHSFYPDRGTMDATVERAQAAGWVVWEGTTMAGCPETIILCPGCRGKHSRRDPAPERLDGEQALFEIGDAP